MLKPGLVRSRAPCQHRPMPIDSRMVDLGTPAPDFTLPAVTTGDLVSLKDFDTPALLVVFLSNDCPYVQHIETQLAEMAARYAERGLAVVGINANDPVINPEDALEHLAGHAEHAGFTFPYLYDADQAMAAAYRAACTPDFFLYGPDRTLAYRGQFDGARPGNSVPVTGESLAAAIDQVLAGNPAPEPQYASLGCNIKWRPGNEPG